MWRYVLACQWQRIGQFIDSTDATGDVSFLRACAAAAIPVAFRP